ncbi:substrate-binding domain-containing protein [Pseudonocardia sp. GCM10023141]|uniref:substrate-binding domain-containing protein n=1 Tax=Pseudonocardia sp. GCM10023141 TaxID=3252653 RepID=UPI003621453D
MLGYDDIPMSAMTHPALSTIAVPTLEAGRTAVAMLLAMIAGSDITPQRVLPAQLIVRATSGPVPAVIEKE